MLASGMSTKRISFFFSFFPSNSVLSMSVEDDGMCVGDVGDLDLICM